MMRKLRNIALALLMACAGSCIDPPLHLPGDDVLVDVPVVLTDMEVVWNTDISWQNEWFYGWDTVDSDLWGPIEYPKPTNYEVRRYYLGNNPGVKHTEVDPFTIFGTRFRRYYNFGYYDMLIWSNIDSSEGSQVVVIDETDIDEVRATTTGNKGMLNMVPASVAPNAVAGIYNQPEIFYSTYPRDIYISRFFEDYDYYDEVEQVWVKQIETELTPLVYIYLVQVILYDNDGRIVGTTGSNSMSGLASSTNVNTGHTGDNPGMVYYETRYKKNLAVKGKTADVMGGKLTTFGLCDMDRGLKTKAGSQYTGTKTDVKNVVYFDLTFVNGAVKTFSYDVTSQMQAKAHGGVITIELNARDIEIPDPHHEAGSLFVPSVDDYDEVVWDFDV